MLFKWIIKKKRLFEIIFVLYYQKHIKFIKLLRLHRYAVWNKQDKIKLHDSIEVNKKKIKKIRTYIL